MFFPASDSNLVFEKEYHGFKNAISVTADTKGNIYILDRNANEILKFDENVNFLKRAGKKGWDNGEFDSPVYIDASSGLDVYVSDGNNYRVQRFDLNLGFISSLITNLEIFDDAYKFNKPVASIMQNSGYLFVIDGDNNRIVSYQTVNSQLTPFNTFGGYSSVNGNLLNPVKIQKDGNNNLYIFDKKRNSVLIYSNFGSYLKSLSPPEILSISVHKNILYMLTGKGILIYDPGSNAYTGVISSENLNLKKVTDFLVYNNDKFLILENSNFKIYSNK